MVKRIGRARRKTRHKLGKSIQQKGKINIGRYMQEFKVGERVVLGAEPAVQKGMYFPRFLGKTGVVQGTRGSCYMVLIKDYDKEKTVLVHPVHLKRVK